MEAACRPCNSLHHSNSSKPGTRVAAQEQTLPDGLLLLTVRANDCSPNMELIMNSKILAAASTLAIVAILASTGLASEQNWSCYGGCYRGYAYASGYGYYANSTSK
jgi:hypothetical protein